ncbi:signal peptidase I [Novosphingobium sp. FSY-8]|uniref:Signal peptidase I n=1 Tax=Novosphingobium ovatum TaxID=1908523 RepID=A0ABW9XDB6_9SPHN|nr:signal peptidase I [Novosphingobium ovatum]NBC36467.1 signal peptidase I [Novosphingobium ovatum]
MNAPADATLTAAPHDRINWWAEARGLIGMLLAVVTFHSMVAKPFYIPSASMVPGLWVGDHLLVSKYAYGWNWASPSFHILPRAGWRVMGRVPEYGDIVITVPRDRPTEDYIKRVVALPGDRIAVRHGQIVLNGRPVPQSVEPPVQVPLDGLARGAGAMPCSGYRYMGMLMRKPSGATVCEIPVLRETMPNGATYLVADTHDGRADDRPEIRIPAGHVFLMGDNRGDSADSRFSLADNGLGGPVALSDIGGRAEFVTHSFNDSTSWNPLSWWRGLRSGRAWRTLRPALDLGQTASPEPTTSRIADRTP